MGPSRFLSPQRRGLEEAMTNLSSLLDEAAADQPDRPALRMDDLVLTYAQWREAAGRMSRLLSSAGIEPGDRVGLMLPNVPAFPIAFYGALAAGAVVVPMNPMLKSREVGYYLSDSGAKLVVAWHAVAGEAAKGAADAGTEVLVAEPADLAGLLAGHAPADGVSSRAGVDDAVILYTSGTTGKPKGAQITHANMTSNADVVARTLSAPVLHSPDGDPAQAATLRTCISGGASLPLEILGEFEEKFGCVILE